MDDKKRVLFVCHGNICRSPVAEAVFRKLVQDAGVAREFEIDSAGISGYHAGEASDPRSCAEASTRGLTLDHSSRQVQPSDFDRFDYILAMDEDNMAGLERVRAAAGDRGKAHVALLRAYDPSSAPGAEVPDPYYGGERGFADVHDIVESACRGLLDHLQSARP
jgi:protein-tyrosine phosphatase